MPLPTTAGDHGIDVARGGRAAPVWAAAPREGPGLPGEGPLRHVRGQPQGEVRKHGEPAW